MFYVQREYKRTQFEVVTKQKDRDIERVWISNERGEITLTNDEIYRLVDIVAISDPEEFANQFPTEG